ncbi:MAG: hypothetical protein CMD39_07425 [Gammaproteobacteria bacterium]|nr:hypothetical protein [Gammaproteobacteria bacterium]
MTPEVLIIESPGLDDFMTNDRVGPPLQQQLMLTRVVANLMVATRRESFRELMRGPHVASFPIVHLSLHGDMSGITFTDGKDMDWHQVQLELHAWAANKIVAISACESAAFKLDDDLAKWLMSQTKGQYGPPRAVLTMLQKVYMPDATLAWGLFYRRLYQRLADRQAPSASSASARDIYESLRKVRAAGLPKICCAFWYEPYQRFVNITPWKDDEKTSQRIAAMENGEPVL